MVPTQSHEVPSTPAASQPMLRRKRPRIAFSDDEEPTEIKDGDNPEASRVEKDEQPAEIKNDDDSVDLNGGMDLD